MRKPHILAIAVLLGTGCVAYRPESAPAPGTSGVRVRFDPPRAVDVATVGAETRRLADVLQLEGRVLATRGDTLTLAVSGLLTRDGPVPGLGRTGSTAVVFPGPDRLIEVQRPDRIRTPLAVLGVAAVGFLALFVALTLPD
jgi:hypothetical protein